ncbi:MAG: hypothetical protein IJ874_09215 [Ruminococcus sp.]|nr:hypothetical protein [Ruminococcus sp.]
MFSYNICNKADSEIFSKQCAALEKHIPNLQKNDLLLDVDGSQTQRYTLDDKGISVHNSKYIGAVYIDSDVDLENFFK